MMRQDKELIFSASDLINFMGCTHATFLDIQNLAVPITFPRDDEAAILLQQKGLEHERAYYSRLCAERGSAVEIPGDVPLSERVALTRQAMRDGVEVIYQGAFQEGCWHGYADFLLRVDGRPSKLGDYAYEVADTKLARTAKPKHLLQLCVYADLLAAEQGTAPEKLHVVLGDGTTASIRFNGVVHYFKVARARFEAFAGAVPAVSSGDPCGHCTFCRWAGACEAEWDASNHLSLVAGMSRSNTEALRAAGVASLVDLSRMPAGTQVPGIQPATVERLAAQARLQAHHRATGERRTEVLPGTEARGFGRLPLPDAGDIFFDMEGDPLFEGGLEYLFGLVVLEDDREKFLPFWAHDREAEKAAFQQTVDFMTVRLADHPEAHIYHYAAYEETALKRLAMYHGTREAEVDELLRGEKLVDLYKVVREAIRTSEPRYSIKNMEAFYWEDGRTGDVKTAGESIVIYERWRRLRDPKLLEDIAQYNEFDCLSTRRCRDWLISLRPPGAAWKGKPELKVVDPAKVEERREAEENTARVAAALLRGVEDEGHWHQLLVDLLEFHRRESKPTYWAMFSRQGGSCEQLLDDAECLADLQPQPGVAPRPEKRSMIHTFTFPAQDFKLRAGDQPLRSDTLEAAGEIVSIDEESRVIEIKLGPSKPQIDAGTCLIPPRPIGDKELRAAVYRYAEAVAAGGEDRYGAVTAVLRRDLPRISGREPATPVMEGADTTAGAIAALRHLEDSYLLIQGPPGTGKTYTSAQAIVTLLADGKRIGIASNSHKAINQLLGEVETLADKRGIRARGVKKSSREEQFLGSGGWIEDVLKPEQVTPAHQLVAGTVWVFARPEHDLAFDYLFVDEAGQVGLANIVAMGVAARNIVLVGDQMQLSQPVQGTHPRASGISGLAHLLGDHPTVPPEQGVFLPVTRRMHPALCRFISDAVYDGRLRADEQAENQRITAEVSQDPDAIAPAGVRFVPIDSLGCTQRSVPEAERLSRTYQALLGKSWIDREGVAHVIDADAILVVSPYNMQVDLLRRTLPPGARVGTVDKFQGQEAAVVLISMATSSGDDLPRNIEFFYSRNRLNVAISRARCLAVIYANPRLLEIPCATIAQVELVDGLCWAKQFADGQRARPAAGYPQTKST